MTLKNLEKHCNLLKKLDCKLTNIGLSTLMILKNKFKSKLVLDIIIQVHHI